MPSQDNADLALPAFPTHNFRIIITPESSGKKLQGLAGCVAPRHIQGGCMTRSSTLLFLRSWALAVVAVCAPSPALAQTHVRIMPLGDSITARPGCWRAYPWNPPQIGGY